MKEISTLLKPVVREFKNEFADTHVEIYNLTYDCQTLKISLVDDIGDEIAVMFEKVLGFRVLDEGNLLEFWDVELRAPGWIWRVQSGGWFDLEKLRQGFLAKHYGRHDNVEYLVCGINECVSVLTDSEPIIYKIDDSD